MNKQDFLQETYNLAFKDELEKIAVNKTSVNYLYHYFDPKDVQSMLDKGGIVTRNAGFGDPSISVTRNPKESYYIRSIKKIPMDSFKNKDLIRFRFSKDRLKNNFKIKPIDAGFGGKRSNAQSEFEERVYTKPKTVKPSTIPGDAPLKRGIIPWKYVDGVEIHNREGLKKYLRIDPKLMKPNNYDNFKGIRKSPRENLRILSKILKKTKLA